MIRSSQVGGTAESQMASNKKNVKLGYSASDYNEAMEIAIDAQLQGYDEIKAHLQNEGCCPELCHRIALDIVEYMNAGRMHLNDDR
jgi:hypothetical protein